MHTSRIQLTSIVATVMAVIAAVLIIPASSAAPSPLEGRSGLPWNSGVYQGNGNQGPKAATFGDWRGRPVDYVMAYATRQSWGTMDDFYDQSFLDFPGGHIISIPSQPKGQDNRETASGANNAWWEGYGQTLANVGLNKPTTIIRLNWEATGGWYEWRVTAAGGPDAFVKAFNNVVRSVRVHAPEVKFTFGMATNKWLAGGTWQEFAGRLGPNEPDGFDYVELDGYDQFPAALDAASWDKQSNQQPGRNSVVAYAESRQVPMWYGEWNVSHKDGGGGDNPYYMQRKYEWLLANAIGNGGWLAGETVFNAPGAPSSYNHTLFDTATEKVNPDNARSAAKYQQMWSSPVHTQDPAPEPEPEPITVDVTATQQSDTAVLVEWTGVDSAAGYWVGRDGTDSTGYGEWSTTESTDARSRLFDKLLLGEQAYTFTVSAIGSDGAELVTDQVQCCTVTPEPTAALVTSDDTIESGQTARLDLTTKGVPAGTVAALQRRTDDRQWRRVQRTTLSASGTHSFTIGPARPDTYQFRVIAHTDPRLSTPIQTITVT